MEGPPNPVLIDGTTVSITMRVHALPRDNATRSMPVWSSVLENLDANLAMPANDSLTRAYNDMEARILQEQQLLQPRPSSTVPHLVASPRSGRPRDNAPLSVRTKACLRRFAHKVKKLFLKRPAPTPEEAQCPCFHYPPKGWRFCRYDEHVAEGIRGIAAREIALG